MTAAAAGASAAAPASASCAIAGSADDGRATRIASPSGQEGVDLLVAAGDREDRRQPPAAARARVTASVRPSSGRWTSASRPRAEASRPRARSDAASRAAAVRGRRARGPAPTTGAERQTRTAGADRPMASPTPAAAAGRSRAGASTPIGSRQRRRRRRRGAPRHRLPRPRRHQEVAQPAHGGPASAVADASRRSASSGTTVRGRTRTSTRRPATCTVRALARPPRKRGASGRGRVGALQQRGGAGLGRVPRQLPRRAGREQLADGQRDERRERQQRDELDARLPALTPSPPPFRQRPGKARHSATAQPSRICAGAPPTTPRRTARAGGRAGAGGAVGARPRTTRRRRDR